MSTDFGTVNDISASRFFGGEKRGVCMQITSESRGAYIQLSAAEIIALMPAFKMVIDSELARQKDYCEKVISEHSDLKKSIFNDMRLVSDMAISQSCLNVASLLVLGGEKLTGGEL